MGLQKLTLLDFPGHMACTVFTGGCNFRCPFCHNASLVVDVKENDLISEDDFFSFLKKRQDILDGVCITGGEPTLQPDLESFIYKVKELGFSVKLDTNGFLPDKLIDLVEKGLVDYVAMDIKSSLSGYAKVTGIENLNTDPIKKSVEFLLSKKVPFEFRTTVVKELHTEKDIQDIGLWLVGDSKYYLQHFVDSGDLILDGLHGYDESEMKNLLKIVKKYLPNALLRGI